MTDKLSDKEKKKRKEARKQQKQKSTTVKTITQPKPEEPPAQPMNLCDDCAYEFGECGGKPKFASNQDETLTGPEADRVIECPAFVNVANMPTADQARKEAAAGPGAAAEGEARVCDIEHLGNYPDCFRDCPKDECDGVPAAAHEDGDKAEPTAFDLALSRLDESGQAQLNARADEIREEADRRFGPDAEPTTEEMAGTLVLIVQETIQEETAEPKYIPAPGPVRPDPKRFQADEDFGTCPSCDKPLKRTAFNRYQDAIRCTNGRCRAYRTVVKTISTGVK